MRSKTRSRRGWAERECDGAAAPNPVGHGRTVPLGDMPPGSSGTINRLSCRRQLRRRLMDMGVVAGTPVKVERVAPLGDPIEIKIKGFHLSLRRDEAGEIMVEVPEDDN